MHADRLLTPFLHLLDQQHQRGGFIGLGDVDVVLELAEAGVAGDALNGAEAGAALGHGGDQAVVTRQWWKVCRLTTEGKPASSSRSRTVVSQDVGLAGSGGPGTSTLSRLSKLAFRQLLRRGNGSGQSVPWF